MHKGLIVTIQRADKTVGGMSYRFTLLWKYLNEKHPEQFYLLTTKSVCKKFNFNTNDKRILVVDDSREILYKLYMLFVSVFILYYSLKYKIKHIHLATVGYHFLPLMWLSKLLRKSCSLTFASNSVEMAAYNNPRKIKMWQIILRNIKKVDILNPTHELIQYNCQQHISVCSFPHIIYTEKKTLFDEVHMDRKNHIIFCGSLTATKNPLLAIEGFKKYLEKYGKEYPDSKLFIFGVGDQSSHVMSALKEINEKFPNSIHKEPYANYLNILAHSKLFLSLQDFDNYPSQSLMEAMLMGNNVIATNFGDTEKLVKQNNGNIILAEKNPDELAEAIHALLALEEVNNKNRNVILHEHTIERFAEYFKNFLSAPTKKKIAIFINSYQNKLIPQLACIQRMNMNPVLYTNINIDKNNSYRIVPLSPLFTIRILQIWKIIRKSQTHHIEVYPGGRITFLYILIATLKGVPSICVERGDLLYYKKDGYGWLTRMSMRYVYKFANCVWYKEPYMLEKLKELKVKNAFFIHNVTNIIGLNSDASPKKFDFLWANRIIKERYSDWFVNALNAPQLKACKALLIGIMNQQKNNPQLEFLIQNKPNNLTIQPFTDPVAYYHQSKYFVLPASIVFANHALLEAMKFGVVPIVTETLGTELIVKNGVNGFVCKDYATFEDTLIKAYNLDQNEYERLSKNARETISQDFSESYLYPKLKELYAII